MATSRNGRARVSAAALRREAMAMRISGHSYREISTRIGRSLARTFKLVDEAMEEHKRDIKVLAAEETARQLAICDRLLRVTVPMATAGDQGAAMSVLKILDRRARLTGVDFAFRHDPDATKGSGPQVVLIAPQESETAEKWAAQYTPKPDPEKAKDPH